MSARRKNRKSAGAGCVHPHRLRLFRSDLLERLTVMPLRAFVLIWTPLFLLVLWAAWGAVLPAAFIGLAILGLVCWSLFEYVLHRFVFHFELCSAFGRKFGFVMHGNHHHDPDDPGRSLMPPIVSVPWAAAIWGLFALLFGSAGSVLFLGFVMGYVTYDAVHYACHQLPVRGFVLRTLRRHHLRHHYGRQEGNYAVTAIVWDRVFGSYVDAKGAAAPDVQRVA